MDWYKLIGAPGPVDTYTAIWLGIGFTGNAIFFSRFMVQWIASERAGRSYIPSAFWWLSILGSLTLLGYALHKRDPVFTLAYLPNCVVYVRNLMLIRKEQRRSEARSQLECEAGRAAPPVPGSSSPTRP